MATNQIKLIINATDNSSTALKALANNINNIKKGVASLSTDTTSASGGFSTMNSSLGKTPGLFSRLASGAKNALTIFGGYKIISGMFNSISSSMGGAFDRLDTMDLFERKMKVLTGDANKATYALNEMKNATKGTAYGLGTAAKAVQNFVTRGMSTEDATKSIKTWMDAVAVYGNGTNEALESVINALGKMRSKGTVEMRHINTMINAGINPVQLYANATNQAAADVQEQLSAKTLRTEEFLKVVEEALRTGANGVAKVTGMAKDMATTWQATFDNMRFALNRGWAALIDGADSLLRAFDEDGLKGIFKGFGENSEGVMSGIGNTLNRAGQTMRDFYADFLRRHKEAAKMSAQTNLINFNTKANINKDSTEKFKNSFLGVMGNYAERMAAGFTTLANSWAKFKSAVAKGINQISPQLGHLLGTIFGEGVTNATDLLNVFLNWATLKVPQFFDWVQGRLQWLIDHKDTVISMATGVLKAFLAWSALKSIENIIVGFNSKLQALNQTLGFFTGGALQLPTLNMGKKPPDPGKASVAKTATASGGANNSNAGTGAMNAAALALGSANLQPITKSIGSLFSSLWKNMKDGFTNFTTFLTDGMRSAMQGVQGFVSKAVTKTGDLMGTLKTKSADMLSSVASKIGGGFKEIGKSFSDAGYALKEVFAGIGRMANENVLSPIGKGVSNFIKEGYAPEIEKGKNAKKRWGTSFHEAFDGDIANAKNFAAHPIKTVKSGVGKVTGKVKEKAQPVVEGMGSSFHKAFDSDIEFVKEKAASVGAFLSDKLVTPVGKAFTAISGYFSENILPAIGWIGQLGSAFLGAVPMIALVTAAVGALAIGLGMLNPDNALSNGINAFFSNFNNLVLSFGEYASTMIQNFVNGIVTNGDKLREQGVNLVLSIVTGILTSIPNLLATGIRIVGSLVAGLVQVLPTLVYQGFMAIGQFIAGLISAIPDVLQGMGNILMALAEFVLTNLPMFIESGIQLVWNIITGLGGMLQQICGAIGGLLQSTWDWIMSGDALSMFQDIGSKLVDWMLLGLAKTSWGATVLGWFGQDADAIIQKAEADGAQTGENYRNNLQATIDASPVDVTTMWNNANIEQNNATAQEMAQNNAGAYVDAEQATIDQATVDADLLGDSAAENIEGATTAGADVGNAYTQTATDTINAGSATVGQAASGVSSQLSLTFDSAVVQEQATNFINTIAVVFTEQAPLLYTTMGNIGVATVNEFVAKVNENLPQAYATSVGLMALFKQGIDEGFNGVREAINLGLATLGISFQLTTETFHMYGLNSVMMYAQGFTEAIPTAVAAALGFKTVVLEQIRGISEGMYSMGVSTINAFHNGIMATQSIVVDDFASLVSSISTTLEGEMSSLSTRFSALAKEMMDNTRQVIDDGLNDCERAVSQGRNSIEMAFYPAITEFGKMGGQMMTNLKLGIQSKMSEVLDKTSELVENLKKTFEEGLGIHSPSAYTTWVGQMLLAGLMRGMTPSDVESWITSVINDMQSSFEGGGFNAAETMDWLSQQGALDLIAKVTGMDLSAVENAAPAAIPAIIQEALKYENYQGSGGLNGSSMFGLHYGNPGAWCVSFVRYCAEQVGVPFPATNYVPDVTAWAQANGRWTMTPQPGYAAIFSNRHIELVTDVYPDGRINYIGGNTGHGEVKHRPRSDATGFVALDGGHAVGNTLAAMLQMAYNAKYNPTPTGPMSISEGSVNWSPSGGVAQWTSQVQQALQMLGQPLSYTNDILYAIERESSGNPNDINNWDSNAAAGINSRGLLQLIPETFARNRSPALSDNIYDPLANIYAGINYMIKKYGSISAVVNPRRASRSGWYGYAVGTRYVPRDMMAVIHEGEAIIPASQNPYANSGGDYLADLVNSMYSSQSGMNVDSTGLNGVTYNDNSQNIVIEAPINVTVEGSENGQQIGNDIAQELHRALTRAIAVGNAR